MAEKCQSRCPTAKPGRFSKTVTKLSSPPEPIARAQPPLASANASPPYGRRSLTRDLRRGMQHALDQVVVTDGEEPPDDVFDLVESPGAEENCLIVRNVVGLHTHAADVQWSQVGHVDLLDLPV